MLVRVRQHTQVKKIDICMNIFWHKYKVHSNVHTKTVVHSLQDLSSYIVALETMSLKTEYNAQSEQSKTAL